MTLTYCEGICIQECFDTYSTHFYQHYTQPEVGVVPAAAAAVAAGSQSSPTTVVAPSSIAATAAGNINLNLNLSYNFSPSTGGSPIAAASSSGYPTTDVSLNVPAFVMCLMSICGIDVSVNETGALLEAHREFVDNLTIPLRRPGNCSANIVPFRLAQRFPGRYVVPMNGYIAPVLVFLTVINNSLVCIVLMKPHMRSPTNTILVAMAISDILTGLFPTPIYIHFFATERFYEWLPYNWWYAYNALGEWIPTIFHTASIWLTMALAIQRYIYVCHSFKARTWCTVRNVLYGTVLIYILSCLTHASRFFIQTPVEIMRQSKLDPTKLVSACIFNNRPFIHKYIDIYFSIYYWFRVIFIHFVPCVSLVVMNALLIYAMKMAQIRRMQLLRQNKKTESRKLKESNCTTLMLVAVVGLFLIVEFPLAILIIFLIIEQSFGVVIMAANTYAVLSFIANFFILLSYPLNFFIYCGMSKQFRETFKRLFTGSDLPVDKEYSQYMTLATENGKSTAVTAAVGDETAL